MNIEKVPTSEAAMSPPCHRTIARAREEAMCIVTENPPRSRAARTDVFRYSWVSATKSFAMRSSMVRVLMVFAPVIASLKSPVMREFSSRICRLARISFLWKSEKKITMSGRIVVTMRARRTLMTSITATAPIR